MSCAVSIHSRSLSPARYGYSAPRSEGEHSNSRGVNAGSPTQGRAIHASTEVPPDPTRAGVTPQPRVRSKDRGPNNYTRNSWSNMVRRCTVPSSDNYEYYGARGISVCDRWLSFENFLADMGLRPDGSTIDRINTDGDYEPGNCRWETASRQQNNKRNTRRYLFRGEMLCLRDISEKYGVKYELLKQRVYDGWTVEEAAATPAKKRRNGSKLGHVSERAHWIPVLQQTPSNVEAARILGTTWKIVEHFRRNHVRRANRAACSNPPRCPAGGSTLHSTA